MRLISYHDPGSVHPLGIGIQQYWEKMWKATSQQIFSVFIEISYQKLTHLFPSGCHSPTTSSSKRGVTEFSVRSTVRLDLLFPVTVRAKMLMQELRQRSTD